MSVVIDGNLGISPVTATGTSALIDGMTVGRGAGEVSTNTAVGASALAASNSGTGYNTAVGKSAASQNTTGSLNAAFGGNALLANTTGASNTAIGTSSVQSNTTGSGNTAVGNLALQANTTASYNTAVGYQAGYSNTTGGYNVLIGQAAGYSLTTGNGNTFVGAAYGAAPCGYYVTTGYQNTILGAYNGNQGGLDIRTANNYIVLSDGSGNPRGIFDSNGNYVVNGASTPFNGAGRGTMTINGSSNALLGFTIGGADKGYLYHAGTDITLQNNASSGRIYVIATGAGVYLATNGTSWTSNSDERKKDIIEPINDAANKVSTLRAVIGKYKTDEEGTRRSFLIAQDVQAVLPEAVDASNPDDLGVQYTEVIPLLVAAIQELKAEFDAYKATHP